MIVEPRPYLVKGEGRGLSFSGFSEFCHKKVGVGKIGGVLKKASLINTIKLFLKYLSLCVVYVFETGKDITIFFNLISRYMTSKSE